MDSSMRSLTDRSLDELHIHLFHRCVDDNLRRAYVEVMLATIEAGSRNPELIRLVSDAFWADGKLQKALALYEMIPADENSVLRLRQVQDARAWCEANVRIAWDNTKIMEEPVAPVSWGIAIVLPGERYRFIELCGGEAQVGDLLELDDYQLEPLDSRRLHLHGPSRVRWMLEQSAASIHDLDAQGHVRTFAACLPPGDQSLADVLPVMKYIAISQVTLEETVGVPDLAETPPRIEDVIAALGPNYMLTADEVASVHNLWKLFDWVYDLTYYSEHEDAPILTAFQSGSAEAIMAGSTDHLPEHRQELPERFVRAWVRVRSMFYAGA